MPESHEIYSQDAQQDETNRASTMESTSTSTMMLTSSLLDEIVAGDLENLNPDAVIPFLNTRLTWVLYAVGSFRCNANSLLIVWQGTDQQRISNDHLSSFSVEVTSTKVRIPDDPSQALEYTNITTTYPMQRPNIEKE